MEEKSESIVEERESLMVPLYGGKPSLRTAHFIKPTVGHKNETFTYLKSQPLLLPPCSDPKTRPLSRRVKFHCWKNPRMDWESWVAKMASLHESTWKQAGIHGAIMSSTCKIKVDRDFVLGLAEKWCSETKSFIFSWGEATITLEDVLVLGNLSLLGSPVFAPLETEELKEIENKLHRTMKEIISTKFQRARQKLWMQKFMDSKSEIQHEAFLAMWLSRFVFPSPYDSIDKTVVPIAVHLARGTRIALAPAALAHIYRDLTSLKKISQRAENGEDEERSTIHLQSPFQLVQVWGWERFLGIRPKPTILHYGELRLSRWHNLKCKVENLRLVLDSAGESFDWRPYVKPLTGWHAPKFYREEGFWVSADSLDDDLLAFARSIRVCQLIGLNCLEQYLPNRVALQFGMDQDIPDDVVGSNVCRRIAWDDYVHAGDRNVYIPPRLFEGDVTLRYLHWWRHSLLMSSEKLEELEGQKQVREIGPQLRKVESLAWGRKRKRGKYASKHHFSYTGRSKESDMCSKAMKKFPEADVAAANPSKCLNCPSCSKVCKQESPPNVQVKQEIDDLPCPPGFPPKCNSLKTEVTAEEDNLTVAELVQHNWKHKNVEKNRKLAASMPHFYQFRTSTESAASSNGLKQLPYSDGSLTNPREGSNGPSTCSKAKIEKLHCNLPSIQELNDSPFPPGFPSRCSCLETKQTDDDSLTISEIRKKNTNPADSPTKNQPLEEGKMNHVNHSVIVECTKDTAVETSAPPSRMLSSPESYNASLLIPGKPTTSMGNFLQSRCAGGEPPRGTKDVTWTNRGSSVLDMANSNGNPHHKMEIYRDEEDSNSPTTDLPKLEIVERISALERQVAMLKAAILGKPH